MDYPNPESLMSLVIDFYTVQKLMETNGYMEKKEKNLNLTAIFSSHLHLHLQL